MPDLVLVDRVAQNKGGILAMAGTLEIFSNFDKAISSTSEDTDPAFGRAVQVAMALTARYWPGESSSDHMTLLGSIAKKTALKPVGDVDVLFHIPFSTYARFSAYSSYGQSALLQEVRGVLRERYPRTDIRGDGPVVVVSFTSGATVEIVPGVQVQAGANLLRASCLVPVSRDGGAWEHADYAAEFDAISSIEATTSGQFTRLIRYMKAWRREHDVTLKSIAIELMAYDFMNSWRPDRSSQVYDDWLIRDFLAYMSAHYYSNYRMPGTGKVIDTGSGWLEQTRRSHTSAAEGCQYQDGSALYIHSWRKVLGYAFGQ